MKKVAVVILNWNGKVLLEKFLPILLQNTPEALADIVVADNASTDFSLPFLATHFPSVKTISLNVNYGFAQGYNLALKEIEQEYAVLLNSDVEVKEGWLEPLVDYLDRHPDTVAAQPKMLSFKNKSLFEYAGAAGGYVDYYGYPFCRGRIQQTIEEDKQQYNQTKPVLWASGACLFIRVKDFHEAQGFDQAFFAHQEEIDLCWRLVAQGKKIVYIPTSTVYHMGAATLNKENPHKTFLNFRNNLLLVYKNMPSDRLRKVLFARFFLDYLAAVMFLMKGQTGNAWAVFRARLAFLQMRKRYKNTRQTTQKSATAQESALIYQGSIISGYYLKGKKLFSQLDFNPENQ